MNTGEVDWIDLEIKKVRCITHSVVSRIEEKFITGTSFSEMTHTKAALELYKVVYQIWNSMETRY